MSSNTGGPAFPSTEWQKNKAFPSQPLPVAVGGMSLRDYFAVHLSDRYIESFSYPALVSMVGRECPSGQGDPLGWFAWFAECRSRIRYIEADAMLKARESTPVTSGGQRP